MTRLTRAILALIVAVAPILFMPGMARAEVCASAEENQAFQLRHLQSRLVVAALSCGQADAYNAFVTRHKPDLGRYGPRLIGYYNRTGSGQAALNRYVTGLANAAASIRAADPVGFCTQTWQVFWDLEQDPSQLLTLAAAHPISSISQPALCEVSADPSQKQTAVPSRGTAAQ
ncbi:MAG: hypothetical protein EXR11_08960 [Rhodospirillaceae bacterium]|nr:hypothetical protein [Rhodospirillaceae bacterium]